MTLQVASSYDGPQINGRWLQHIKRQYGSEIEGRLRVTLDMIPSLQFNDRNLVENNYPQSPPGSTTSTWVPVVQRVSTNCLGSSLRCRGSARNSVATAPNARSLGRGRRAARLRSSQSARSSFKGTGQPHSIIFVLQGWRTRRLRVEGSSLHGRRAAPEFCGWRWSSLKCRTHFCMSARPTGVSNTESIEVASPQRKGAVQGDKNQRIMFNGVKLGQLFNPQHAPECRA